MSYQLVSDILFEYYPTTKIPSAIARMNKIIPLRRARAGLTLSAQAKNPRATAKYLRSIELARKIESPKPAEDVRKLMMAGGSIPV